MRNPTRLLAWALALPGFAFFCQHVAAEKPLAAGSLQPVVEAEAGVYGYEPADNGAGPMWCHGSTCLVRVGRDVFASGLETLKSAKPLNNCRWLLFRQEAAGWRQIQADNSGRTREPCPLAGFPEGRLFLSANPTRVTDPAVYSGPATPEVLEFSGADAAASPRRILPEWEGSPAFTEHSYRSFAADGPNGELILFQNIGYTHAEWAYRNNQGRWTAKGQLKWPWGAEYDKPQPIRVCYPTVALVNRSVHFCGVSDIVEPSQAWRAYKKQLTGRDWDYDFRRLFYVCCPDIAGGKFGEWLELASRDKTCGWIFPGDLWVAPDSAVHIVWTERALDERLREKFFPTEKQSHAINYAVIKQGKVVSRRSLVLCEEGKSGEVPSVPRFQIAPPDRLVVCYYTSGRDAAGRGLSENRLLELRPDGAVIGPVRLPLNHPMSSYFTATVRAGSPPSPVLEMLGHRVSAPNTVSYARVRLW
jgi:hypothetical protein